MFTTIARRYISTFYKHNVPRKRRLLLDNRYNIRCLSKATTEDIIESDSTYEALIEKYMNANVEHKCFVIQPYVKWGPKKLKISPQCQLDEAVSLVNSLKTWEVVNTILVPLETLDKKTLFGKGNLTKLVHIIRNNPSITSIFINVATIRKIQLQQLEQHFGKPIYDRYSVVIQVFRLHATSKQAKLQVALAEIPFLQSRLKMHETNFVINSALDTKNLILQTREKKIRASMKQLRTHRELLRHGRSKTNLPVVAVVGYTNVGKTSLIKALTGDSSLVPRDQFFATLDVTFHAGVLPSTMKVLYIDTVGFLSDIPTELIDCFTATLEDAFLADVILHIEDLSSNDILYQRSHVLNILEKLSERIGGEDIKQKILLVGNKCDMCREKNESILNVSAKNESGLDVLKLEIERKILETTKRHILCISLPIGGDEVRWLYKNATVVEIRDDEENSKNCTIKIIIAEAQLNQFKHYFISSSSAK